jgi:hypothetical protein
MKKLKFAHMADLHLGAWREKSLRDLNLKTFRLAVDRIIDEEVNFCVFCGDIFNSAMPGMEIVRAFVLEVKRLNERGIKVFTIGGSHDYSSSGKSFLELLDEVGVIINVGLLEVLDDKSYKLVLKRDDDLKINIGGIYGKKSGLDRKIYERLIVDGLDKDYFNLFLFHSAMEDFKPKFLESVEFKMDTSFLPKGFDYYGGGHIHENMINKFDSGAVIAYPGALFPNNFRELKNFKPSFNLCSFDFENKNLKVDVVELNSYDKEYLFLEFDSLSPCNANSKIISEVEKLDVEGKIVMLEFRGEIDGKVLDVGILQIVSDLYDRGAYEVLKNTYKLKSKLLESVRVDLSESVEEVEKKIIDEYLRGSNNYELEQKMLRNLLDLDLSKDEGETNLDYENKIVDKIDEVLNR